MILTDKCMSRCIDHVQMEEIHNSLEELAQPPIFSLRMRGDSFFSHSICIQKNYGKVIVYLHDYLYIHPLTIYVQDVAPRRSILLSRPHGLLEAMSTIGDHSLGGIGEENYFGGHTHLAPYIIHFPHTFEESQTASKWLRGHTFWHTLM